MKGYEFLESMGLPAAPEAERMILASVIIDPECFAPLAEILERNDFSLHFNRLVWDAMTNLHESGAPIDTISLGSELERSKALEAVGGLIGLCAITDGVPQIVHPETYARIVQQKSLLRQTIQTCDSTIQRCLVGDEGPDVLEFAQRTLAKLRESSTRDHTLKSAREIIEEIGIEDFLAPKTEIAAKGNRNVPLPFPSFAEVVPCFRPGQLIVVAARPGIGKSACAGQLAYHAALSGITTALFSLEMENREILNRIVCGLAEVNGHSIKRGHVPDRQKRTDLQARTSELCAVPLYLDERTGCTVASVSAAMRKLKAAVGDVGFVVIDYLQLMETISGRQNRNDEITEISRGLKKMAREFQVPVIALSQLSRAGEKEGRAPILSDLRDSGAIEQDADIVIFLHPKGGGKDYESPTCEVDFIAAKNRGGPVKKRTLTFMRDYTKFVDPKVPKAHTQRNFHDGDEESHA